MHPIKLQHTLNLATLAALATLTACGGGGGAAATPNSPTATPQSVQVPLMISDASSPDWSNISVTILSVTFTDSNGNTTANLLSAPYSGNLENLDNVAEALNSATLVAGTTYVSAALTISANPGDVGLTVASDPETGFAETANTVIPSSRINIQNTQGASGSLTVAVPVKFASPYTAPAPASSSSSAPASTPGINVEFDLSNPAFLIGHVPVGGSTTSTPIIWAVDFGAAAHQKTGGDITHIVLRHHYGQVASISTDNSTLTIDKVTPTAPATGSTAETATVTTTQLPVTVDASNGTLFYNLDSSTTPTTITSYASVASILSSSEYVRVAARYQQNGTLVASRIYASSTFNKVYVSPEGHVVHADTTNGLSLTVDQANGTPMKITVNGSTQFYFRSPNTAADAVAIGNGPGFLKADHLVRGFKVRVTPVDLTASPIVAASVDIESAPYQGAASDVTAAGFVLSSNFPTKSDNYSAQLTFIASSDANGNDPVSGSALTGFKYWNYAYPSLVTSGSTAVTSFGSTTGGANGYAISFGNGLNYAATVLSYTVWGDPSLPVAQATGYYAPMAILMPTTIPGTTVATATPNATTNSFTINAKTGTSAVTVDFSSSAGSATLVYQVDRSKGIVTVSPQDLTTAAGLAALQAGLVVGNRVDVYGVPQSDGSLKAYQIRYYTGMQAQ